MDRELWEKANEILLEALGLAAEERSEYLDRACRGATALREEVQSLLDADEGILEQIDRSPIGLLSPSPIDFQNGERLGPYQIEQELGRGGIGAVYLASRADGEYSSKVAIKVLKRGMDSDEVIRRFRIERQILANLKHPNIAELYDGGTTPDHRPYLVMEYVDGEPIDRYCDQRRLGIGDRLELFLDVCAAVQLAHRNLIIHRDIKPGNILVDPEGKPKLLDFGIAKLLEPSSGQESTATGLRPMTPHYASPEQAWGNPVTTASDVYSLGVLLFELLTGRCPYRPATGEAARLRAICEEDPPRLDTAALQRPGQNRRCGGETLPSVEELGRYRGLEPKRLARRLRGDLDNITRKALRKEPEHRYPSVEAFAQDIRRHRSGLPVMARRHTFVYSASKLFARRRRELALASLVGVLLVAFLADRHQQQKQTALERDRAVQISSFLGNLFAIRDLREAKGAGLTMKEVLDHGAEKLENELDIQDELEAELLLRISDGYHALGLFDSALPLQQKAVNLIRAAEGPRHLSTGRALAALAATYGNIGRYAEAEAGLRESLDIARASAGDRSQEALYATNALAAALMDQGHYADAEPLFRDSLEKVRQIHGEQSRALAAVMGNLGVLLYKKGDYEESEKQLNRAVAISAPVFGPEDPMTSSQRFHLGYLYLLQRSLPEAEELLLEVLATYRRKLGAHPAVARTLHALSQLRREQGKLMEAEDLGLEALEMRHRFRGPDHPAYADSLVGLAEIHLLRSEVAQAQDKIAEAQAIYAQTLPANNWRAAHADAVDASRLLAQGQTEEARALLQQCVPILRVQHGGQAPETQRASARLESLG